MKEESKIKTIFDRVDLRMFECILKSLLESVAEDLEDPVPVIRKYVGLLDKIEDEFERLEDEENEKSNRKDTE